MTVLSAPTQPAPAGGAPIRPVAAPTTSPRPASESVEELHWKLRIAFLWLFLAVGMSAMMILTIMEPGVISQALGGKLPNGENITATVTVMFALFWLVPLTMAVLTLVLNDSISRPANGILGLLGGVIWFTDYFEGQAFGGGSIVTAALVVAGLLITGHAWRWPHSRSFTSPAG